VWKTHLFETVAEKYSSSDDNITDEKIFVVATAKKTQNDRLYLPAATTKKKDVATKRLRTRSAFGQ